MTTSTVSPVGPGWHERRAPESRVSQIVSFVLANREYGIDVLRVQEIIPPASITPMPDAPDYICGQINLRGRAIPVVDLRRRFGLAIAEDNEDSRILVVTVHNDAAGLLVDSVNGVLRIDRGRLHQPTTGEAGIDRSFIRGVVQWKAGPLILLNAKNVVAQDALLVSPNHHAGGTVKSASTGQ
jgi:purine-binding chemotaxis protein CheW